MAGRAAKTRDFDELERRRMLAAKLLDRGLTQAEVARQVNVSRESVRRWANQIAAHGAKEGLKKAGRAGRMARLGAAELRKLEQVLLAGPEKYGFRNGLWTLERIAEVVREQFGVEYHTGHVWWVLRRKLGWTCLRPALRRSASVNTNSRSKIWSAVTRADTRIRSLRKTL